MRQILSAKNRPAATTEAEKNRLDTRIESLDWQIDEAFYELYGLTEEEIAIIDPLNH